MSDCQGLGRKNKHGILKTDRIVIVIMITITITIIIVIIITIINIITINVIISIIIIIWKLTAYLYEAVVKKV